MANCENATITIETLIEELDALWGIEDPVFAHRDKLGRTALNVEGTEYEKVFPEVADAPYHCNELLITNDGRPDYSGIKVLEKHGYKVMCTERDGFGWLGAVVLKEDKVLYFG